MSWKVTALRVWRGLGLNRSPVMQKLRKTVIPNTRSWDNADIILQGLVVTDGNIESAERTSVANTSLNFTTSNHVNLIANELTEESPLTTISLSPRALFEQSLITGDFRNLSNVDFWSNKLIQLREANLAPKVFENCILVRNTDEPTDIECELYAKILSDNTFIAFRKRHLNIIDLNNSSTNKPPRQSTDDLTHTIERMVSKSKAKLLNYGFVIAVNPQNIFSVALQQASYISKLICIFTEDFKGEVDKTCIEQADRIICPAEMTKFLDPLDVAGIDTYDNSEQLLDSLITSMQSFFPSQFNMLLPVWQSFERVENIDKMSLTERELVLKLNCTEENAPSVNGSFSEYIDLISKKCTGILANEALCQQYVSLIEDLDNQQTRSNFLKRAFRDGARCEFIYA